MQETDGEHLVWPGGGSELRSWLGLAQPPPCRTKPNIKRSSDHRLISPSVAPMPAAMSAAHRPDWGNDNRLHDNATGANDDPRADHHFRANHDRGWHDDCGMAVPQRVAVIAAIAKARLEMLVAVTCRVKIRARMAVIAHPAEARLIVPVAVAPDMGDADAVG